MGSQCVAHPYNLTHQASLDAKMEVLATIHGKQLNCQSTKCSKDLPLHTSP